MTHQPRPRRTRLTVVAVSVAFALSVPACRTAKEPAAARSRATTSTNAPPTTTTNAVAPTTTSTIAAVTDAASAAVVLARVEPQVRDPATAPDVLPSLGRAQQAAYRAIAANPAWLSAVLTRVPPAVRSAVEANATAAIELRALTKPRTELPPWRIVAPPPADDLQRWYHEAEAATGIPWAYLAAVHLVETKLSRIVGPSAAGAQGPMQFLPATWARYGEGDIHDTRQAILAAGRLLRADGGPADMGRALFAYNHSEHYVKAVTLYAQQMLADARAFLGYYEWQVYYRLATGDVLLDVGYGA